MRYFSIEKINRAIRMIREGNITLEHVSSRAASELARHYFDNEVFTVVPEQVQLGTKKRPDYTIEKFMPNNALNLWFVPHAFIEVKSLVGLNMSHIVDQLQSSVNCAMDYWGDITGNYSAFMIGIKGTKIAFYVYHNVGSILDEAGIPNYRGLIPLNYKIPWVLFNSMNENFPLKEQLYSRYLRNLNFDTDYNSLAQKGVTSFDNIPYPHVFDLQDIRHREEIHRMFLYVAENTANYVS